MEKVTTIKSRTVVLPVENVDTDQIIPARFLKATSKVGLGSKLFADWRFAADGQPKAVPVMLGPTDGAYTELVSGDLKDGQAVIIGGGPRATTTPAPAGGPPVRGPRLF